MTTLDDVTKKKSTPPSLLQRNVLDRRRWDTSEQLRTAIVTWIERTYYRRRRQARLGRLTPIEYEAIINNAATAA